MQIRFALCSLTLGAALNGCSAAALVVPNGSSSKMQVDRGLSGSSGYSVLHVFQNSPDGAMPVGGVIVDKSGRIFGTTRDGGTYLGQGTGVGTVFELQPAGGSYDETIIHNFSNKDLFYPLASPAEDASHNLFVTAEGDPSGYDGGVVELSPAGSRYKEAKVFRFDGSDGMGPQAAVLIRNSRLYATTVQGGRNLQGSIVELSDSGLSETDLYDFQGYPNDGAGPFCNVVADAAGALYGTTQGGGAHGDGTVFRFAPSPNGGTETVLYSFQSPNGIYPLAGVILDDKNNIYGTTESGGTYGSGVLFKLSPQGTTYKESVLHNFKGPGYSDGAHPDAGLTAVGSTLYGTTVDGGGHGNNDGTIYRISTTGSDYKVLYDFVQATGSNPGYGALFASGADLYGTTQSGGAGFGVVYKFVP